MPHEAAPHQRTWMAFGASADFWGEERLAEVQKTIALIARSIARYEPVTMLVRQADYALAESLCGSTVQLLPAPIDDIWIRDTGPVFLINQAGAPAAVERVSPDFLNSPKQQGKLAGVNFNFNGWGRKQYHSNDAKVAQHVLNYVGAECIHAPIVAEGGAIDVDGQGTAILTESCIFNTNRNPGSTKEECDRQLQSLLGLQKIIWLPGIQGKEITDGHTDLYARFIRPGCVVVGLEPDPTQYDYEVTREHLKILRTATDARGRTLDVIILQAPRQIRLVDRTDDFAASYVNFYITNGAVLMPEFGDQVADENARNTLIQLFPEREVVQLRIDALAAWSGGIHCATQQEPCTLSTPA